MSTPEGKVKAFISTYMKTVFPDAWKYMTPGGRFGRAGTPDFLYLIRGVFVAIEAKAENGQLSVLQEMALRKLKECGAVVAVVRGRDKDKMEAIRDTILSRIRLADPESESPAV
jgi:hypothetical protein